MYALVAKCWGANRCGFWQTILIGCVVLTLLSMSFYIVTPMICFTFYFFFVFKDIRSTPSSRLKQHSHISNLLSIRQHLIIPRNKFLFFFWSFFLSFWHIEVIFVSHSFLSVFTFSCTLCQLSSTSLILKPLLYYRQSRI